MPRQPGESADRYQQLLSPIIITDTPAPAVTAAKSITAPVTELQMLEARFKAMEQRIEALEKLVGDDNGFT